jgi:hypothetical protein
LAFGAGIFRFQFGGFGKFLSGTEKFSGGSEGNAEVVVGVENSRGVPRLRRTDA